MRIADPAAIGVAMLVPKENCNAEIVQNIEEYLRMYVCMYV
jgi:hypothetical protein